VIRFHSTNGLNGEICVDWDGFFVGFIARCGDERRWCAYTRTMEQIGDRYKSRADAATACYHRSHGSQPIRMSEFRSPGTVPALAETHQEQLSLAAKSDSPRRRRRQPS